MTSLKANVQKLFDKALAEGALNWMKSTVEVVPEAGIKFQIRLVPSLAKKPKLEKEEPAGPPKKPFNPFLPPEPKLLVGSAGPNHNLVLNKFCINRDHFILSTKTYTIQNELLTLSDLSAIWRCILDWDSEGSLLVFHNCGPKSGASQPHKHVQAIPAEADLGIPIENAIFEAGKDKKEGEPFSLPAFKNFAHKAVLLPSTLPKDDPQPLLKIYRNLVASAFEPLGISLSTFDKIDLQAERMDESIPSHNLLLTQKWILCVPRQRDEHAGIGANSVGYAGWLLATDERQMELIKSKGPMYYLEGLAYKL